MGAFTFIENLFALTIVVFFFAVLYAINSQSLLMLNAGRGAAIAGKCLQDRAEQLRNCTWSHLTDPAYVRDNVMNSAPLGVTNLGLVTETVTVNAYSAPGPSPTPTPTPSPTPFTVVRSNGSVVASPSPAAADPGIVNAALVRVDLSLSWTVGIGARTRTQSASTVIAKNVP